MKLVVFMVLPFFMRNNPNTGSSLCAEQALLTLLMLYVYQGMMAKTCNLCHFFVPKNILKLELVSHDV